MSHKSILGLAAVLTVSGCARTAACQTADGCEDETGETVGDGDGDGTGDGDGDGDGVLIQLSVDKSVDVLFVIDNSGSMGEEQAQIAQNFAAFVEVLDAVEADYRIGITTTDNGNPWCPAGQTTPEGGKLVLSSCKSRLGDFVGFESDVQDLACNDICPLDADAIDILPTTTDVDDTPQPRPWLERINGQQNIPEGISMAEAFACVAPQGINGCGFESQLESMYLALVRMQSNAEQSYGFLRVGAPLAVIFLTDEADCSYNKDWSEIFEQDGNKVFWSDPNAAFPTSAVCWNAGVQCTGDPSNYDSCDPADKDVNGNLGASPGAAVLHPMDRYLGLLAGIEAESQAIDPDTELIVSLIAGVDTNGEVFYVDVSQTDPEFQDSFGIGPGCTAPNPIDPGSPLEAVPPVRLRALAEGFGSDNMFSICDADYSPALEDIANVIKDQIQPACFPLCVADSDPNSAVVEPTCTVEQDPPGNDNTVEVPECLRDQDGYVIDPETNDYAMPSAEVDVCFAYRVDTGGQTGDPGDDMSEPCLNIGTNLEFAIARRAGVPAPGGTAVSASCELAEDPGVSCPGL